MPKLLILGLNFFPEPTGTGKYTGELAEYLAAQGHAIRVVTAPPYYPHWRLQDGYSTWRYTRERWGAVEILRCPLWVPRRPRGLTRLLHLASFAIASLPAMLAQARWKPDLVLCIAPTLMNAPAVLLNARLAGAQSWLHLQDFELDAALKLGMLPWKRALAGFVTWIERRLLESFDIVSTISERMLARLAQKGIPPGKSHLFPNWVDTAQIKPLASSPNRLRVELGFHDQEVVVLYAGTLGQKQGLETILEAARLLTDEPSIRFVICGDGAARESLVSAARGMENLVFLPVQPVERLNELLNLADIHLMPQRADAADLVMPSKLAGMLASGKPVVATAQPQTGVGEVAMQAGVLVPPEDPQAMAQAVRELVASPERRERLGRAGRAYATAHWEREQVLAEVSQQIDLWLAGKVSRTG